MNKILLMIVCCLFGFSAQAATPIELEAEDGTFAGNTVVAGGTCANVSGSGFIKMNTNDDKATTNNKVTFSSVQVTEAGTYKLDLFYFSGDETAIGVSVNGSTPQSYDAPVAHYCFTDAAVALSIEIELNAGDNTIELSGVETERTPFLDKLVLTKVAEETEMQPIELEAETGALGGAAEVAGATCGNASGSGFVKLIQSPNNTLTFSNINVTEAGAYTLDLYYFSNVVTNLTIDVNGDSQLYNPPATNFCTAGAAGKHSIEIQLNQGTNTIVFSSLENKASPLLDKLAVTKVAEVVEPVEMQPIVLEAESGVLADSLLLKAATCSNSSGSIVQLHNHPSKANAHLNTLELSNIDIPQSGEYKLTVEYFSSNLTYLDLEVNGVSQLINEIPTGVFCYQGASSKYSVAVSLNKGMNTLIFRPQEGQVAPLVDRIFIEAIEPSIVYPKVSHIRTKSNTDAEILFMLDNAVVSEQSFDVTLTGLSGATLSANTVTFPAGTSSAMITFNGTATGTGTVALSNVSGGLSHDGGVITVEVSDTPATFYVSSEGDDSNNGMTENTAWASLETVSNHTYIPGDQILFRKGDTFIGQLVLNSSGVEGSPISIGSYGVAEADKPVLDGANAEGGAYLSTIYINNQDYIEVSDLKITNDRQVSREGVKDAIAYGFYVYNDGDRTLNHFRLDNLDFENILSVASLQQVAFNEIQVTAVYFLTARNTVAGKEKKINDVIVENCYFTRTGKLGIWSRHNNSVTTAEPEIEELAFNTNFIIRNNHFFETGGSGVVLTGTYNALLEGNTFDYPGFSLLGDYRLAGRGSGAWFYRCKHVISQYNISKHARGNHDSYGQHIDAKNTYVILQYNYSEDSNGGFAEILGANEYCTYRYNVSVNDGLRGNKGCAIWVSTYVDGGAKRAKHSYFYNNSLFVGDAVTPNINIVGEDTYVFNNAFYVTDNGMIGEYVTIDTNAEAGADVQIDKNLYYGNISTDFSGTDNSAIMGNPRYVMTGENEDDIFRLEENSPALGASKAFTEPPFPHAGQGIFENITANATKDYYGNPVDLSTATHIGAFNGTALAAVPAEANISLETLSLSAGDTTKVTVMLNKEVYEDQTVNVTVGGVDSELYTLSDASVTIAQDTKSVVAELAIKEEAVIQNDIIGTVSLSNPSAGVTLGDEASVSLMVLKGDPISSLNDVVATMKLFPNPAIDFVKVETKKVLLPTAIVRDFTGRQIMTAPVRNGVIDIQDLSAGMYLLEITTQDKESMIFKIVKQ